MSNYTITHACVNVNNIPDPIEPEAPAYDIEMAQAFGSHTTEHWVLHSTNVVGNQDLSFVYFFWTWKLEQD